MTNTASGTQKTFAQEFAEKVSAVRLAMRIFGVHHFNDKGINTDHAKEAKTMYKSIAKGEKLDLRGEVACHEDKLRSDKSYCVKNFFQGDKTNITTDIEENIKQKNIELIAAFNLINTDHDEPLKKAAIKHVVSHINSMTETHFGFHGDDFHTKKVLAGAILKLESMGYHF